MAVDLRTKQEYLNSILGTVGLTVQQCLQRLVGAAGQGMTAQDAALNYAGTNSRTTIQGAIKTKVGSSVAGSNNVVFSTQEELRRLASFTPSQLSGLVLWLKADAETYNSGTTPATDGQAVTTWGDQSASNNDATGAGTAKPLWRATGGANSKPALEFDGIDDSLDLGSVISGSTISIFAVWNHTAILGAYSSVMKLDNQYLLAELTSAGNFWGDYLTGDVSSGVTVGSTFVVTGMVTRAFNDVDLSTNGTNVVVTTGTSFNAASGISSIGSNGAGGQQFTGKVCELIIYSSALSTANRRLVEGYLGSKYGITVA